MTHQKQRCKTEGDYAQKPLRGGRFSLKILLSVLFLVLLLSLSFCPVVRAQHLTLTLHRTLLLITPFTMQPASSQGPAVSQGGPAWRDGATALPSNQRLTPSKTHILYWLNQRPSALCARLQRELKVTPSELGYQPEMDNPPVDPCFNIAAYFRGFQLPQSRLNNVHPLVRSLRFQWQGGRLRRISLRLRTVLSDAQVRRLFHLPGADSLGARALYTISINQDTTRNESTVSMEAFKAIDVDSLNCSPVEASSQTAGS